MNFSIFDAEKKSPYIAWTCFRNGMNEYRDTIETVINLLDEREYLNVTTTNIGVIRRFRVNCPNNSLQDNEINYDMAGYNSNCARLTLYNVNSSLPFMMSLSVKYCLIYA